MEAITPAAAAAVAIPAMRAFLPSIWGVEVGERDQGALRVVVEVVMEQELFLFTQTP
jgi:hypothetical protein